MEFPISGGCECGAVRYEISGPPRVVYACHCSTCQTQSGSAFGLAARFHISHFSLTRGELTSFTRPATKGHTLTNSFCADCGTRIHHVPSRFPELVSLKPGTLDDTGWLEPEFHIFARSAQPWFALPEGAEIFEAMPTDLSLFAGKQS